MGETSCEMKNWADVRTLMSEYPGKDSGGWYVFRGEEDESWKLEPSLLRECRKLGVETTNRKKIVEMERDALEVFQRSPFAAKDRDKRQWIYWWGLMQHYDAATRMLDWSGSLLIALYFAVRCSGGEEGPQDGKLWILNLDQSKGGIPNPADWMRGYRPYFERLPDRQKSEAFEDRHKALWEGYKSGVHWCTIVGSQVRVRAQEGWFTTCTDVTLPHDVAIREKWEKGKYAQSLREIRISGKAKASLLGELRLRGIHGGALFADSPECWGQMQRETLALLGAGVKVT